MLRWISTPSIIFCPQAASIIMMTASSTKQTITSLRSRLACAASRSRNVCGRARPRPGADDCCAGAASAASNTGAGVSCHGRSLR